MNQTPYYPARQLWIQFLCPAPKRFCQQLIRRHGIETGLDIGCGGGSLLSAVRSDRFKSTGIDISADCAALSQAHQAHDRYIVGDFMSYEFTEGYDVVVLSHVIEHFDRDRGMEVLRRIETLARRVVYVETPYGFLEQTAYDGNCFQRHLSGWFPHDFESRGYTVFGSGPRWLKRPMGTRPILPELVVRALTRGTQWFYFRRPHRAATIAAIRYLDEEGNLRTL